MAPREIFAEKLEACRREKYRSADASAITGESVRIDSEKLDRVPEGRFNTEVDGAHFECFLSSKRIRLSLRCARYHAR